MKKRSRLYRIAVAPKTIWLFAQTFRRLETPRWFFAALRWTWLTIKA